MEVDEPLEEPPRVSNEEAPDMLGPNPGSGSRVTAAEDRALDTPGGFSRAPGDGRPITGSAAGSSGRRITGTLHRGVDAKALDLEATRSVDPKCYR